MGLIFDTLPKDTYPIFNFKFIIETSTDAFHLLSLYLYSSHQISAYLNHIFGIIIWYLIFQLTSLRDPLHFLFHFAPGFSTVYWSHFRDLKVFSLELQP